MDYIYSRIDNNLVDINKIKDLVLKTCDEDNVPFEGLVKGNKYLELTVVDSDDIIYCSLADLQAECAGYIEIDLNDYLSEDSLSSLVNFLDRPTYFTSLELSFENAFPLDDLLNYHIVRAHYCGSADNNKEDDHLAFYAKDGNNEEDGYLYFYATDDVNGYSIFAYKTDKTQIFINDNGLTCVNTSDSVDVDISLSLGDTFKLNKYIDDYSYEVYLHDHSIDVYPTDTINVRFDNDIYFDEEYYNYDHLNLHFDLYEMNWIWDPDCSYAAVDENQYWRDGEYYPHVEPIKGANDEDEPNYGTSYSKYIHRNYDNVYRYEIFTDPDDAEGVKEEYDWIDEFGNDHTAVKLNYQTDNYIRFNFNMPSKCAGRIYVRADMDNFNQASNKDKAVVSSEGIAKNELQINGDWFPIEESYSRIKYRQWFGDDVIGDNRSNNWFIPWVDAYEFREGANSITISAGDSGNLTIYSIVIIVEENYDEHLLNNKEYHYITFNKLHEFDGIDKWSCSGVTTQYYDNWFPNKKNLSLNNESIIGTLDYDIPIKAPNLDWKDDKDEPIDNGKFLQLSYNYYYDKVEYVHTSAQEPIPDLSQIRYMALQSINDNAKSYVKSRISSSINDLKASENYWTAAQHFSASIYADIANINTLYGSDNVSKPVSQIALLDDLSALSSVYAPIGDYVTNSALSSAISGLSSVYASEAALATKQDALVINPIIVTDENRASIVQSIISMLEDIVLSAGGDNSKHYDVTYRFNGAEEDGAAMRAIWESLDSECVKRLIGEMDYRSFQILTNGSYTLDYDIEEYNYIRTSFDLKISLEIDPETGDPVVVVGPCPRLFGEIRFIYDYEPLVED